VSAAPRGSRAARLAAAGIALAAILACGGKAETPEPAGPPPKVFPKPLFDGLWLGMNRDAAQKVHPMRPAVTAGGRDLKVWVYEKKGEYTVMVSFTGRVSTDTIRRLDVHYGPTDESAEAFIKGFEPMYGTPDVLRRQAVINSYGDKAHRQFETIWSDETQYVFLTERVPMPGKPGRPVYFLTLRHKELAPVGKPTGYIPPPALDEDGNPVEEQVF
jgi:hypothetical protein